MFSYISLEERVPQAHPLRKLRAVVDALLATMNNEFEAVYARRRRPSVPPEMLLKALLLQILFSIRNERQLLEAINYNLLYRWFVDLNIEDPGDRRRDQRCAKHEDGLCWSSDEARCRRVLRVLAFRDVSTLGN